MRQSFLDIFYASYASNAVRPSCAFDDLCENCSAIDWMKIIFPFVRRPFPLPLT